MKKIIVLIISLILVGCTSQVTVTSEVTVTLPAPTPSLIVLTETSLACRFETPAKLPPSQFSEWCNTGCPLIQNQYLVIKTSENARKCDALFPLTDYKIIGFSFTFPVWWRVNVVGAAGKNLILETDKGEEVFVQLATAKLPLERSDEATDSFEFSGPDPLVAPEEEKVSKEIQTIGDKETLVLVNTVGDLSIKRYFVIHDNTLYMFKIEIPKLNYDDEETSLLFLQVEEIISSVKFIR